MKPFKILHSYFQDKSIQKTEKIFDISIFSRVLFGGAYRSRTDHQSFADSCLTAWLRRLEQVTRIGLVTKPWQGLVLPLNYTCIKINNTLRNFALLGRCSIVSMICYIETKYYHSKNSCRSQDFYVKTLN